MSNPERDQVRRDIKTYENQKKIKRLAQLGTLAAIGGMGYGSFSGNKKLLAGSTLATAMGGYGAGRAHQKSQKALGRIKKYYDLRDDRLINMNAVLPDKEEIKKHAMVGGIAEALSALPSLVSDSWVPMSHAVQHVMSTFGPKVGLIAGAAAPAMIDVAATPGLAKWMTNRGTDFAKVFAKQQLGHKLSQNELKMVGKAFKAKGAIASAAADKTKLVGPLRRYFTGFFAGPAGIGSELGEHAGAVLKHVGEISPRYQNLGLEAINSPKARNVLLETAKSDIATLNKGVEAAKTTRLAKLLTFVGRGSAPSLKQLASDIAEHPHKLEEMVAKYKGVEDKVFRAGQTMATGLGGAIVANTMAKMRPVHPLAKDELPKKLSEKVAFLDVMPTAPPPMPSTAKGDVAPRATPRPRNVASGQPVMPVTGTTNAVP